MPSYLRLIGVAGTVAAVAWPLLRHLAVIALPPRGAEALAQAVVAVPHPVAVPGTLLVAPRQRFMRNWGLFIK